MKMLFTQSVEIPVAATIPFNYPIKDFSGVTMTRPFYTLLLMEDRRDGKGISVEFKMESIVPTAQQINDYFTLDHLIKICVTNAETINTHMKSLMLQDIGNIENTRSEILSLDFMGLKDYLMEYIKKEPLLKCISMIDTLEKFKEFRKNFDNFIVDRNIFTHGQLKFFRPSLQYVIEFHKKGVPAFVGINTDILTSHNLFYNIANQFLNEFHMLMSKRRKD